MRPTPATRALTAGVTIELDARGGSMWPLLRSADRLRVEPAGGGAVGVGDIVVRRAAHGLIAHRVVATAPLRTRGDAFDTDDWFADGDGEVIGRVVARCRRGRWLPLDGWRAHAWWLAARSRRRLRAAVEAWSRGRLFGNAGAGDRRRLHSREPGGRLPDFPGKLVR